MNANQLRGLAALLDAVQEAENEATLGFEGTVQLIDTDGSGDVVGQVTFGGLNDNHVLSQITA